MYRSEKAVYIISGSEDQHVYMWETNDIKKASVLGSSTKSAGYDSFKGIVNFFKANYVAHGNTVTVTLFAPFTRRKTKYQEGQILATADASGEIKVFENRQVAPKTH